MSDVKIFLKEKVGKPENLPINIQSGDGPIFSGTLKRGTHAVVPEAVLVVLVSAGEEFDIVPSSKVPTPPAESDDPAANETKPDTQAEAGQEGA